MADLQRSESFSSVKLRSNKARILNASVTMLYCSDKRTQKGSDRAQEDGLIPMSNSGKPFPDFADFSRLPLISLTSRANMDQA